jgi:hypothetical protein
MKKLLEASFRIFNLMVVVILLYIKKKDEMIKKKFDARYKYFALIVNG